MNYAIGIPYKSQAHFDLHEMSDAFYYLVFNSDRTVKLIESDSDDLNNPHSVVIASGTIRKENPLTIIFGCTEDEGGSDLMTARPGSCGESMTFDVKQADPRIFSDQEVFTRIDKWRP
jgi:hypothetical protein